MNMIYKSYRIIEGKPRWVIVDESGDIINKCPSKKDLKSLNTEISRHKIYRGYTNEELLNCLRQFFEDNLRVPMAIDFASNPGYPSFETYRVRFGSWNNAIKISGLDNSIVIIYTDDELLNYLKDFYQENKKIPTQKDFTNNPGYPSYATYHRRFGSWNNALKLVEMDVDTLVKKGILETDKQKARWSEILVISHFEEESIDLSGNNCNSIMDGICPNGQTYDVKSSKLLVIGKWRGWSFGTGNKDKGDDIDAIQWYYFIALDEDFEKMLYVWRVPGEIVEKDHFVVGFCSGEFNIENMKEYDITNKFNETI